MNNKSKIGEQFSDAFSNFEIKPPNDLWLNVQQNIPKQSFLLQNKYWILSSASVVIFAALVSIVLFKTNHKTELINNQEKNQPIIIDQNVNQNVLIQNDSIIQEENEQVKSPNIAYNQVVTTIPNTPVEPIIASSPKITTTHNSQSSTVQNIETPIETPTISNINLPEQINKVAHQQVDSYEIIQKDTTIKFSSNPTICFGESAKLEVFGGEFYQWNTGSGASSMMAEPVSNSTYTVTVTDKFDYKHIHQFEVFIDKECSTVYLPSAFSPNGDGNNDVFKAVGENIQEFKMQIMNREGRVLFVSNNIDLGWDGYSNGQLMPTQVYIYKVIYQNGHGQQNIVQGQVTLIR